MNSYNLIHIFSYNLPALMVRIRGGTFLKMMFLYKSLYTKKSYKTALRKIVAFSHEIR